MAHTLSIAAWMTLLLCLPFAAYAAPGITVDGCNNWLVSQTGIPITFNDWDYTAKVVYCLKGMIIYSIADPAHGMLQAVSVYMLPIMWSASFFAIVVFGMRVLNGEREITRKTVGFLLRLGLVMAFSWNLNGWGLAIFNIEDEMINLVSGGEPWYRIDDFLGKLFGAGPQIVLFQGLMGILGGALTSSTVGVILFIAGFLAILDILTFLIRVVFTYLAAYLVIAFMIIISPIVIPLALFFTTEYYFRKWVDMLISAMLTPVLLFAFLQLFVPVFIVLVAAIFAILGFPICPDPNDPTNWWATCPAPDFRAYWKLNQPLFSWLVPGDPTFDQMLTITTDTDLSDSAVQSNINPLLRRGFNANILNVPGIDFGLNNLGVTQQLVFAFMSLWIFASLMKSMVGAIPDIASGIAASASPVDLQSVSIKRMATEAKQNIGLGAGRVGMHMAEQGLRSIGRRSGGKI
jgi:hypothetical protein